MNLQQQIKEDMKAAMKAKESNKVMTLRSLMAAFINELVALKRTPQDELSDDEVTALVKRAVKQRKDAINQFVDGGRDDLAEDERKELAVLESYMPDEMNEEEIRVIAKRVMNEQGVADRSKMGVLIGMVMKETGGNADGQVVKAVVENLFD